MIVEALAERRGGGFAAKDLRGHRGSLLRRGVFGDLDVVDDAVDDLRLCQIDIDVVLLLGVYAQVILYVALLFNV